MNGEETMSGNGQTQDVQTQSGQTHDGQVQSAQTISHDSTAGATMNSAAAFPAIAANVADPTSFKNVRLSNLLSKITGFLSLLNFLLSCYIE